MELEISRGNSDREFMLMWSPDLGGNLTQKEASVKKHLTQTNRSQIKNQGVIPDLLNWR